MNNNKYYRGLNQEYLDSIEDPEERLAYLKKAMDFEASRRDGPPREPMGFEGWFIILFFLGCTLKGIYKFFTT